jgi:protein involved in polysaccharide export with SLBB domain
MKLSVNIIIVICAILVTQGCGVGTGKRVLTRPISYERMLAFPSNYEPLDLDKLFAEYPELKGIVITAPQYIEEYERLLAEAKAKGEAVVPYRIPPGLSIEIDVVGEPGYPKTYTVGPHGKIDMAMIGEVVVVGRTIDEVKTELIKRFSAYIKKPEVLVNITGTPYTPYAVAPGVGAPSIAGGDIVVLGVTGARGTLNMQYTGRETLISILGITGLPSTAEWRQVRVIRRSETDRLRKSRIIICDLWNYFALGDVRQDIPLMPGDVIFVPYKWTLGEQFKEDWNLMLDYIGGVTSFNSFRKLVKGRFE